MHIIFYAALWYATVVIRKMEKSNAQMLKVVRENRTRLEDVAALKDKKTEYEEVVIKVKEAQKVTSAHLENELRRLSTELIAAAEKLSDLEQIVEKVPKNKSFLATNRAGGRPRALRATSLTEKPNSRRTSKVERPRSRTSRFWNRPFHRLYLRPENMESLSLDLLGNVVRLPRLQLQLQPKNSDSSNNASVEASSESMAPRRGSRAVWSGGDYRDDKRRRRCGKFRRFDARKLFTESLRNVTPFTRSLLGLATLFTREKF
ncbi:uncharacterized protein LOC128887949 [Hylaeus anthracinus]|uniref:uncharacterized protein LOC128887949 n=1 Tax=Hylaeus anthracinus TaxID=313031 RepID=UPI0023B9342C|nr:uncharacterized protein LOC128887949 [Hylaeus anthracinus]